MFFGSFTLKSDEKRQQKQNYTIFENFDLRHGRKSSLPIFHSEYN